MIIGNIKNYKFCTINRKIVEQDEMFLELKEYFSDVLKVVCEAVNNNEFVIGLKKKNSLKVIYIFEKNEEDNSLKIGKTYKTKEITDDIINQFEYTVKEELKAQVSYGDISKVEWGEFVIKEKKVNNYSYEVFFIFLFLGILYGIYFNNFMLGLLMGLAMGGTCGAVIEKKDKKKKKDCENNKDVLEVNDEKSK